MRAGRPTIFNVKLHRGLVKEIRAGAYDWVAAEAVGIGQRTFYRWIERGERGEAPFATFARDVKKARALARLGAEKRVREEQPLAWLRMGPGRERRGQPGWTEAVKAQPQEAVEVVIDEDEDPTMVEELAKAMQEALEEEEREREGE